MIEVEAPFPAGTVGIVSADVGRFISWTQCILQLRLPKGSHWSWSASPYVHANRNNAAKTMKGDWLFFVDDDNTFDPDIIFKLIRHGKPVVGALYCRKAFPFLPHAYLYDKEKGPKGQPLFNSISWATIPKEGGLLAVDALATSGMLIQRWVIDMVAKKFGEPFEQQNGLGEDMDFCHKVRQLGIPIFCDTSTQMGHCMSVPVKPVLEQETGIWIPGIQIGTTILEIPSDTQVQMPVNQDSLIDTVAEKVTTVSETNAEQHSGEHNPVGQGSNPGPA